MSEKLNLPQLSANIPRAGNRFTAWIGRTGMRLSGWRFKGEFPDCKKMLIAIAPHTSNWDFFIGLNALLAMRLKLNFFGKDSIFVPPVNGILRRLGGIPIDRSAAHGVVEDIAAKIKQQEKMILAIAPEGTRSKVANWKSGFLTIARKANMPVLLIGFDYEKKQYIVGPMLKVGKDIQQEMQKAQQFYATVQAKFPDKVCYPELTE